MPTEPIVKLFQLHDEREQAWIDVYCVDAIDKTSVIVEVPREIREPHAVRRILLRSGASAAVADNTAALAEAINTDAPVKLRAAFTGWRNQNQTFVSHCHVAGATDEGRILSPSLAGMAAEHPQIRGTLKGWQRAIEVAQHSTSMTLALCAAFAAPLLELVERPNFALMLYGPSRVGKSITQVAAASVQGIGREEDLPSLNATPSGLLATGLASNGHLLVLNEVGTMSGAKRDIYVALRTAGYQLMTGRDVERHPSWPGAQAGAPKTFRVVGLLSSEVSPDTWAERNGEVRDPGETARVIGVPVLMQGAKTIFDRPPKGLTEDALDEWTSNQFGHLRDRLPKRRGVALQVYLDWLLSDVSAYRSQAVELISYFERNHLTPDMHLVSRDIVGKFAVLLAGGLLAEKAGVLPLDRDWICQSLRRSCFAALKELPNPEAQFREDRQLLKDRLSSGGMVNLDNASGRERRMIGSADGFHQPYRSGRRFVIRAQTFASWFGSMPRHQRMLGWLDDEGFLEHTRIPGTRRSSEWAQKQTTWPDETRVRSINIYLPYGLDDLDRGG